MQDSKLIEFKICYVVEQNLNVLLKPVVDFVNKIFCKIDIYRLYMFKFSLVVIEYQKQTLKINIYVYALFLHTPLIQLPIRPGRDQQTNC